MINNDCTIVYDIANTERWDPTTSRSENVGGGGIIINFVNEEGGGEGG